MTFHYHPTGSDANGNGGPDVTTPGWVEVEAESYDEAYSKLPRAERIKIQDALESYRGDEGYEVATKVEDLIADSAGWGLPFTLLSEEEWKNLLDDYAGEEVEE